MESHGSTPRKKEIEKALVVRAKTDPIVQDLIAGDLTIYRAALDVFDEFFVAHAKDERGHLSGCAPTTSVKSNIVKTQLSKKSSKINELPAASKHNTKKKLHAKPKPKTSAVLTSST